MIQDEIIINKCPILLNNGVVIVVRFENVDIQFPYFDNTSKYVYVACENGKYRIIDEKMYKEIMERKLLRNKKKNIATKAAEMNVERVDMAAVLDEEH